MKLLLTSLSILVLFHSPLLRADEPKKNNEAPVITHEEVKSATSMSFWGSFAIENAARQTLRELDQTIQRQKKELKADLTESDAMQKGNALKANMAQSNRLLLGARTASIVNIISFIAMAGADVFPLSAENRPKRIFCEKNPDDSPRFSVDQKHAIGQNQVICRAVALDAHFKPIEKITLYQPEVGYRSEYGRSERTERLGRQERTYSSSSASVER